MINRNKLVLAALAGTIAILFVGSPAHAGEPGTARRGQPCAVEGSYARDRSGDLYVCEWRKGQACPTWHSAEPRPGDWGKPSPCVCPSKSATPKPSKSPSASPTTSPSLSPSKPATVHATPSGTQPAPSTTPVGQTLPVTGVNVPLLAAAGLVLIAAGGLLVRRTRRN